MKLRDLLDLVAQRQPGAIEVLTDYLRSEGLSEGEIGAFVWADVLGPQEHGARPHVLYDTVVSSGHLQGVWRFFRDYDGGGAWKGSGEMNWTLPMRIETGTKFAVRLVTATISPMPQRVEGVVTVTKNMHVPVEQLPLAELVKPLGLPVQLDLTDGDDIQVRMYGASAGSVQVRLHGWRWESTR